jgi:hypothetical protein
MATFFTIVKEHSINKVPMTYGKLFFKNKIKWGRGGVLYDVGHLSVEKKYENGVPGLIAAIFTKVKEHSVSKILIRYEKKRYGKIKIIRWGSLCD